MFIKNKYTKWYFNIIANPNTLGYTEKHHIIPRCMGGPDTTDNIVKLSARQHFICHLLLPKMVDIPLYRGKLSYGLKCMLMQRTKDGKRYIPKNSRIFEMTRRAIKGIPKSDTHKQNLSRAKKGVKIGSPSEETRKKQSLWQKGKPKPSSPETREKKRNALLGKKTWMNGKKHTTESLLKMSLSQKARIRKPAPKHSQVAIENNRRGQLKFIYTIMSPTGEVFFIRDMKKFCSENSLPYGRLADKSRVGEPIKLTHKTINKNSIGWVVTAVSKYTKE